MTTRSRFALSGLVLAAGLLLVSLSPRETAAQGPSGSAEEKGFAIAARSDRSDRGFGDSAADLEMILRNQAGREVTRALSVRTLEVPDESTGDLSLVVFNSPPDIAGTGLLPHSKILEPDDQWLYLPALKRVKRISSVNKSGPFVGSEFAFEDFTSLELGKFEHRHLRQEPCGGESGERTCDVIERTPRYEHSGYSRLESWVDQGVYQVRKVDFFDRKGTLLKTLTLSDYRQYDDAWWRPHRLEMINHVNGKSTDLIYGDYEFGLGLDEADFDKAVLQRLR